MTGEVNSGVGAVRALFWPQCVALEDLGTTRRGIDGGKTEGGLIRRAKVGSSGM